MYTLNSESLTNVQIHNKYGFTQTQGCSAFTLSQNSILTSNSLVATIQNLYTGLSGVTNSSNTIDIEQFYAQTLTETLNGQSLNQTLYIDKIS